MNEKIERHWRVKQIAEEMGMHPSAVYREIERGALGHVILGRHTIRVPQSELSKWLARCKREAVA